jgi:hypothetical protein
MRTSITVSGNQDLVPSHIDTTEMNAMGTTLWSEGANKEYLIRPAFFSSSSCITVFLIHIDPQDIYRRRHQRVFQDKMPLYNEKHGFAESLG